jgi:hypothetical protein
MSIAFHEKNQSRDLKESRDDKGITLNYVSLGSSDPVAVRAAALLDLPTTYAGLYRNSLNVRYIGGTVCDVDIEYGLVPSGDSPGSALGEVPSELGGDPNGGDEQPPPANADPGAPLPLNFTFSTSGGTTHITQSRATVLAFRRGQTGAVALAAEPTASQAKDYKQAINLNEDTGEIGGVDIVTAQAEFSLEARRAFISQNYFNTLFRLTGTVNDAPFKGFQAGEVLYLGCEGKSENGAWGLTHKFSAEPNQINLVLNSEITVTQKAGWDYLWVAYTEKKITNIKTRTAEYAYVEQVYRKTNFAQLEIGN